MLLKMGDKKGAPLLANTLENQIGTTKNEMLTSLHDEEDHCRRRRPTRSCSISRDGKSSVPARIRIGEGREEGRKEGG